MPAALQMVVDRPDAAALPVWTYLMCQVRSPRTGWLRLREFDCLRHGTTPDKVSSATALCGQALCVVPGCAA